MELAIEQVLTNKVYSNTVLSRDVFISQQQPEKHYPLWEPAFPLQLMPPGDALMDPSRDVSQGTIKPISLTINTIHQRLGIKLGPEERERMVTEVPLLIVNLTGFRTNLDKIYKRADTLLGVSSGVIVIRGSMESGKSLCI